MRYRGDDVCLDREKMLLTRGGSQIEATWKVLDCIFCLVEQRHRVVSYDELIRRLWARKPHQQPVLADDRRRAARWATTVTINA